MQLDNGHGGVRSRREGHAQVPGNLLGFGSGIRTVGPGADGIPAPPQMQARYDIAAKRPDSGAGDYVGGEMLAREYAHGSGAGRQGQASSPSPRDEWRSRMPELKSVSREDGGGKGRSSVVGKEAAGIVRFHFLAYRYVFVVNQR